MREDIWKSTTTIKDPIVNQYKTVKGSTEWVDKEIMSMIDDGWHVHGLPHSLSVSNNIVIIQTMVKYASVKK